MSRLISVVVPVYNDAGNLRQCLAALRDSETQPAECIVVDDGSTDSSAQVAAEYGAKLLLTGGNHGVAVAFAAMKLGKPAKIFVPSVASATP
jgi:glycosyltransferase involved in cell wall biosynthesis